MLGYLVAILATIVVMLIFEHGQPALLYLVPGTILAVLITAFAKGEFKLMWEFNEEVFILKEEEKKN
jgi:minor histocompatibility antigen H13